MKNPAPGNLAILGSTGSIGQQALEVVRAHPDLFQVVSLAAGSNVDLLIQQAQEFKPQFVAISEEGVYPKLKQELSAHCELAVGEEAACHAASFSKVHTVLNAVLGYAGLSVLLSAIEAGKHVALANKESLVVGNDLVQEALAQSSSKIVPVDSEHSSIFQCFDSEYFDENICQVSLTASGGPFLNYSIEDLERVRPEDAVRHPRWEMGKKISVDSATLMNKGLEVIEAAHLFGLQGSQIRVLVHPQSLVHGMLEFSDGVMKALLHQTDMKIPIAYALGYLFSEDPKTAPGPRLASKPRNLVDLVQSGPLEFFEPDLERFPALSLCYQVLEAGGLFPAVLNAADEIAVQAFLADEIAFLDIYEVVSQAVSGFSSIKVKENGLEAVKFADAWARQYSSKVIKEVRNNVSAASLANQPLVYT